MPPQSGPTLASVNLNLLQLGGPTVAARLPPSLQLSSCIMEYISTLQREINPLKPSLFEILSEQQLSDLLPPTLRYLTVVAAYRRPQYFLRLLNSFNEVYALLSLLIEQHFLRTYNSSFIENFYGLKRERVLPVKGGEISHASLRTPDLVRERLRLRQSDVWKNLVILVALPYAKRKLDEAYEIHVAHANVVRQNFNSDESLQPGATLRQRFLYCFKWFLRKVYPNVNAAYHFTILAFNLLYLFDRSGYHSPLMWLVGTRIRRMSVADFRVAERIQKNTFPKQPRLQHSYWRKLLYPWNLGLAAYPYLLSSLRVVLPTSIFALKFLEWWHASDFARQLSRKAIEGLDLPRPSISRAFATRYRTAQKGAIFSSTDTPDYKLLMKAEQTDASHIPEQTGPPISRTTHLPIHTVPIPSSSSLCPICASSIVIPTAAPTGHVYCYTCIYRWVDGSHAKQAAFMEGTGSAEGWGDEEGSRGGRWESGQGRCAVTGMKLLGGTEALRRIIT